MKSNKKPTTLYGDTLNASSTAIPSKMPSLTKPESAGQESAVSAAVSDEENKFMKSNKKPTTLYGDTLNASSTAIPSKMPSLTKPESAGQESAVSGAVSVEEN